MSRRRLTDIHDPAPAPAGTAVGVSAAVGLMERTLSREVGSLMVRGEVSDLKRWRNGNYYFDLKDARSHLPCMMRESFARRLSFDLDDGLEVVAHGRATLYRQQMKAQLQVTRLEPVGAGQFLAMAEKIKKRLTDEGVFRSEHKKALPPHISCLGVVTSAQGAVIQDIVKVLKSRHAGVSLILAPTRVQGAGASEVIASQLRRLDATRTCDVIIVGRGGGSLEDLLSFSTERVVRAIAACETPVISAVGHETDTSLADLVADRRAATPTEAAEMAVPLEADERRVLSALQERMERELHSRVSLWRNTIAELQHSLHAPPLQAHRKMIDALRAELHHSLFKRHKLLSMILHGVSRRLHQRAPDKALNARAHRLQELTERLRRRPPRIDRARGQIDTLGSRLDSSMILHRSKQTGRLETIVGRLAQLNPLAILARGFAVVHPAGGSGILRSTTELDKGDRVAVRFHDGIADAEILSISPHQHEENHDEKEDQ